MTTKVCVVTFMSMVYFACNNKPVKERHEEINTSWLRY